MKSIEVMIASIVERLQFILGAYSVKSYSQEGEDMILRRLFENQQKGFYVDIGAHHPFRFSNTCHFYYRGWQGINIDPLPGCMDLFDTYRPRDINLEIGISNLEDNLSYYLFNEPALNSFSKELAERRDGSSDGRYNIEAVLKLKTRKLADVLAQYLPVDTSIDLLNVDVEGFDLQVLQSNDWARFRPRLILVEIYGDSVCAVEQGQVAQYLKAHGYYLTARTMNTGFFKDTRIGG